MNREARQAFIDLYHSQISDKLEKVMAVFNTLEIEKRATTMVQEHTKHALAHLYKTTMEMKHRNAFQDVAEGLLKRGN